MNILRQIVTHLRETEAVTCVDPRNIAWALAAADALEGTLNGCDLLIDQRGQAEDYKYGGKLTNEPFFMIIEGLSK